MNIEQWKSVLRNVGPPLLSGVCGYMVAKGTLTTAQASALMTSITDIVTALVPLATIVGAAIWGANSKSDSAITTAAGNVPGVKVQVDTTVAQPEVVAVAKDPANKNVVPK